MLPHNPTDVKITKIWIYGKLIDGNYIITSTDKNTAILLRPTIKKYFNDAKKWIKKTFDVECFPYTDFVEIEWYFILTEEQFLIWVLKYLKDLYED